MKYFTRELFCRLQSEDDRDADAADADWDAATEEYRRRLGKIRPLFSPSVRRLAAANFHDAEIETLAHEQDRFDIVLRLPSPSRRVVFLTYHLSGKPMVDTREFPDEYRATRIIWLYDEVDIVRAGSAFVHRILLSNGWQIELRFRNVRLVEADGLLHRAREAAGAPMAHTR